VDNQETDDVQAKKDQKPSDHIGMGALIGIGAGVGLVFGIILDNLTMGMAIGAGLGTAAGAILEGARGRR
jgi:uncharacterized membrane protein